jgi:DNA helicase IV
VTAWVASHTTNRNSGPYSISWEKSDRESVEEILSSLKLPDQIDFDGATLLSRELTDRRLAEDLFQRLNLERRVLGSHAWTRSEVEYVVRQSFSLRRRRQNREFRWSAMSVHGAKNREFDSVVVLWPAAISGSADQKRRLLYNAITRAKDKCLILVQARASLSQPPFA